MTPMMTISERCRAVAHTLDLEGLYTQAAVVDAAADRIEALRSALVDLMAMIDSPQVSVNGNWDGSTKGQWKATIREARAAIAKAEAPLS